MPKPNSAPQMKRDGLHLEGCSNPIPLGSQQWLDWLQDSNNKSFRFEGQTTGHELSPDGKFVTFRELTFTAVKSKNGKLWNAQKRVQGKLRGQYLGTPEELTWERMTEVALTLNSERYYSEGKRRGRSPKGDDEQSHTEEIMRYKTVSTPPSETCDEIEQLRAEVERLKQRESYLLDQLGLVKTQIICEAQQESEQLKKRNTELDNHNWELEKRNTQLDDLYHREHEKSSRIQAELAECKASKHPSASELLSRYISAECGGSIPTDDKGKPKARYDQLAKFKHWLESR